MNKNQNVIPESKGKRDANGLIWKIFSEVAGKERETLMEKVTTEDVTLVNELKDLKVKRLGIGETSNTTDSFQEAGRMIQAKLEALTPPASKPKGGVI